MTSRIPFAMAQGLFLHFVLRFEKQMHGARKVAWQAGILGGPKATVALNTDDGLYFSVLSAAGEYFSTQPLPHEKQDGWIILWCWLEHFSDTHSRLCVAINGSIVAETSINGGSIEKWGFQPLDVVASLGSDVEGFDPCALTLMQQAVVPERPSQLNLRNLLGAMLAEYAVGPFELVGNYGNA